MPGWLSVVLGIVAALAVIAVGDVVQTKHAILRVYPILGRLRYLIEKFGPEIRQYIVTSDLDGIDPSEEAEAESIVLAGEMSAGAAGTSAGSARSAAARARPS